MSKQFIIIAGNIATGKTTLTEALATRMNWRYETESVEDNPYLGDFYDNMKGWAFHLQMHFLLHRFRQHQSAMDSKESVILDRSIYIAEIRRSYAEIQAGGRTGAKHSGPCPRNRLRLSARLHCYLLLAYSAQNHRAGHISDRDIKTYERAYEALTQGLPPPNLIIYLTAPLSLLLPRIQARGRLFERSISEDYLSLLDREYESWVSQVNFCPILRIRATELEDFRDPIVTSRIVGQIEDAALSLAAAS